MDEKLQQVEASSLENHSGSSDVTCRICLVYEVDEDDDLISPCMCKGTQQFVHRSCLDSWRSIKEGFDFSHCSICKAQFHLRVLDEGSWSTTIFILLLARDVFRVFLYTHIVIGILGRLAYHADKHWSFRYLFDDSWLLIVSRHSIPFYYCVGILLFFVLLYLDGLYLFILSCCYDFNDLWMEIYQARWSCDWFPEPVNVCFGLLSVIWLVLTSVCIYGYLVATEPILAIWERHYNILIRKHIQTYVVKDLKGCYTPAKLDPKQMERLKRLKLL